MKRRLIAYFFGLMLVPFLQSCGVSKGFEALSEYNYFAAKKTFDKRLKRHTSPAAFGLSVIYLRQDNPFHNIDSAYHYSLLSIESYKLLKPKKKEKLATKFSFFYDSLISHRNAMSEYAFSLVRSRHQLNDYVDFMVRHPWSIYKDSAIFYRDLIAYEDAIKLNTSIAYTRFLRFYSESRFVEEVQELLYEAQYRETTADGSLASFERFIEIFSDNPYLDEAHDVIYELVVPEKNIKEYEYFVRQYPNNPNTAQAWLNLYRLSTADYTKETIEEFSAKFPDFPYANMLYADLAVVGKKLYPFKFNNQFGYMDEQGLPIIPAQYQHTGLFSNGLASVVRDGKLGFIDKNNDVIIDFLFDDAQDFDEGRAVVEIDGYFGWIDRTGDFVLPAEFDDIGSISNQLIYAYKDDQYAFFNKLGEQLFDTWFDEVFAFNNGLAKVIKDKETGFIRTDGSYLIRKKNADLRYFSEGIFIYDLGDSMNLITPDDSLLLPFFVDRIGMLSENRAIIEKEGSYGYIDENGTIVIPIKLNIYPNYFQFAQYNNGHARVSRLGKYALLDSLGENVLPAIFTNIGSFGPLIAVTKGDKWGYVDASTRLVIRYIYDYAYDFVNGVAVVTREGNNGLIDLKGDIVLPISYSSIRRLGDSLLVLTNEEQLFALYNLKGDQLTTFRYHRFHFITESLIQLEASDRLDYFEITNNRLITLQLEDE